MIFRQRLNPSFEEPRYKALQSAVVFRDCSLRTETSISARRAYRTFMREQAIAWRRAPLARIAGRA